MGVLAINDQTLLNCDEISDKLMILTNALEFISSVDIEETERILSSLPKLEILVNELKGKIFIIKILFWFYFKKKKLT